MEVVSGLSHVHVLTSPCTVARFYRSGDKVSPRKGVLFSVQKYYNLINVKTPCNIDLNPRLSEYSSKAAKYETTLKHLGISLGLAGKAIKH